MRVLEFKMERAGLVKVGDVVQVTEGSLPSSWYYMIEPAVAMSANIPLFERLKSKEGKIIDIRESDDVGFYLSVEFDE
ncbi:MAG: hypothetical protein IKJ32_02750 [Clostridia bacterium]|nr:hypothetical protein [Clostridia bacterium]